MADVETKYDDESNSHIATIKAEHSDIRIEILIAIYQEREDIDSLLVEVFQNDSLYDRFMKFRYIQKVENLENKTFAKFPLQNGSGFKPPFIVKISTANGIDLSNYEFIISDKSLLA